MWIDKEDDRAVFMDNRILSTTLCDGRSLHVCPDIVADFTKMPFGSETFWQVVFDPPHMNSLGENSWMAKKYGFLFPHWKADIKGGFDECWRVLKTNGTLIFKWNETDISIDVIMDLIDQKPLYAHRMGKKEQTIWITYIK